MAILHPNERNAKKDRTVVHPCVCFICCCVLKESDIHYHYYSYCKMRCCLLVGTQSGRLKYNKRLLRVSLLAHLILMNMLRLNALIFQN